MSTANPVAGEPMMREFAFQQFEHRTPGRRDDLMALHRRIAPAGLTPDCVARQALAGAAARAGLAHIGAGGDPQVEPQLFEGIVNGSDAACRCRHLWRAAPKLSADIAVYSLSDGTVQARLFH